MTARTVIVAAVLMVGAALPACGPSQSTLSRQNDRLRAANLELQREVETLRSEVQQRQVEVRALEAKTSQTPAVEGANLPRLTQIKFDRYSGALDTDRDGRDNRLRVYVRTLDQEGRFLLVAGRLQLQAAVLRPDQPPLVLADVTLDPDQLSKAYRSGVTGTHYTVETVLSMERPADARSLAVRVVLTDAATGATVEESGTFALRP